MIVGWQAATGANLSMLFPNWPTFIQDINIGFLALGVNIVVSQQLVHLQEKLSLSMMGLPRRKL
ncbi:hypothetical protein EP18_23440 [Lysinibacillus sphaericus]|nr:hypothetical protein [Lysinibacillus sphaericus]KEK09163.1 hypothetical protein EP18_23440 [Lysinibacillus sphaericus]